MATIEADVATEDVNSFQLRDWAPFLDLQKVQAGDILLTRGRGVESTLIAKLGGGHWSHAAFWTRELFETREGKSQDEPTTLRLVEADDFGVGPTLLLSLHLNNKGRAPRHVARLSGDPLDALLLRHPSMTDIPQARFNDAIALVAKSSLWRKYPTLDRLVEASALPSALKPLVRWTFAMASRVEPTSPCPGPFCSELVGRFFDTLGLSLFADGRQVRPEHLSPNHFVDEASALSYVPFAIIRPEDIEPTDSGQIGFAVPTRESFLSDIISVKHTAEKISIKTDKIIQNIQHIRSKTSRISMDKAIETKEFALNQLNAANQFGSTAHKVSAKRALIEAEFSQSLAMVLYKFDNLTLNNINENKIQASIIVREFQIELDRKVNSDIFRSTILFSFYIGRKLKNIKRSDRHRCLSEWQDLKRQRERAGDSSADCVASVKAIRERLECREEVRAFIEAAMEITMKAFQEASRAS